MTFKSEMRDYLTHSSNRDIATLFTSGEFAKLQPTQQTEARYELKDRAKNYYGIDVDSHSSTEGIANEVIAKLDKLEKEMPKPYEKNGYFTSGKVSLVPVHWLKKFQGNSLRRYEEQMQEFSEELVRDGLKEPVMISIGQHDRQVSVGEGNHRMNAFIMAGLDFVPARVLRSNTNWGGQTQFYDKMSRVPLNEYYQGDASPDEVFDTYYDKGDIPTLDVKAMKKMKYDEAEIPVFTKGDGVRFGGEVPKGIFGKQFSKVSKTLLKQFNEMTETYEKYGGEESITYSAILDEAVEWYSKKDGMMIIDVEKAIEDLGMALNDIEYEMAIGKRPTINVIGDDDDDDLDLDDLLDMDDDELEDLIKSKR